jgi:hypothetical protein
LSAETEREREKYFIAHLCTATMQIAEQYDAWKMNKKTEESKTMMMNKSL